MKKIVLLLLLLLAYAVYSGWVYTVGVDCNSHMNGDALAGRKLWHEHNCQTCHQLYGLGGYMGPDLTTVTTDKTRGALYAKGILKAGGKRMPNFHFTNKNTDDIVAYLQYINDAKYGTAK